MRYYSTIILICLTFLEPPYLKHFIIRYSYYGPQYKREAILTIQGYFTVEKTIEVSCRSEVFNDTIREEYLVQPVGIGTKTKVK